MAKLIHTQLEETGGKFLIKRNQLLLYFLFAFCISACSSSNTGNVAIGYVDSYKAIRDYLFGSPDLNISRETIENIPYASMLMRMGNGPQGLLILESKVQEKYIWVSADDIYIVIKDGKIIQTGGFFNNLTKVEASQENVFKEIIETKRSISKTFFYTFDNPRLLNLELNAEYSYHGSEKITILGNEKELIKIEEILRNSYLGWQVQNYYWIDDDLVVWKSEQHLSPKLPKLSYTLTKKPS